MVRHSKSTWWNVNPVGVITTSLKCKWKELLNSKIQFVAFIDRSYKVDKIKGCLGGVRCVLRDIHGNKKMSFSRPVIVHNAMEVEEKAFEIFISLLQGNEWREVGLLVFPDNVNLVKAIHRNQLGLKDGVFKVIEVQHINRNLNIEADSLAKNGSHLTTLVVSWV